MSKAKAAQDKRDAILLSSIEYYAKKQDLRPLLEEGTATHVEATIDGTTSKLRGWFFCLAFVGIGLQTDFRELAPFLRNGKPLALYLCGQTLNVGLTLLASWLLFKVLFGA